MIQKTILVIINLVFGSMVILSYAHNWIKIKKLLGLQTNEQVGRALWGGVPEPLQPIIFAIMFISAAGYFFFTYNFLFNVDTNKVFLETFSYSSLHFLYLLIFIPSMVWMGLTVDYINSEKSFYDWAVIVLVLFTVGVASLLLFLFTLDLKTESGGMYLVYVLGSAIFAFHTLFLDALLWTTFFHRGS
ncbi:MAG: hypothetical protein CMG00_09235 [Candidatus Marinimicrobia bacterium]|nr:hypothetical protein [Candidatus Neomarinimicrobiota bacterium]|tara:strand:+ start:180 stop:743 length:564 start_codon:yes stop_codon:yes gene_type:complete